MNAAVQTPAPRTAFASVSCSMCGNSFGPGISGYSSCSEHRKPLPEITFHSHELGGEITCSYEGDDDEVMNYQLAVIVGEVELVSVTIGSIDMTQHMTESSLRVIGFELGAALQKQAEKAEAHAAQEQWERRMEQAAEYAA